MHDQGNCTYFIPVSESDRDLAVVSQDVLHRGLGAVHQSVGDPLRQAGLSLGLLLHSEVENHGLDGDALHEHRPVDHGQGGGDEHLGVRGELLLYQQHQGKGDSTSETTIHHDQLLRPVEFLDPVSVGDEGEDEYSNHPDDCHDFPTPA